MMEIDFSGYEEVMKAAMEAMQRDFSRLRSGRVSGALLDKVRVQAYGSEMPVNQVASISVPEPRVIVLQPFDKSTLGDIERAIQIADIGVNPNNDGNLIRLVFPSLTEERRKEFAKMARSRAEDAKVSLRSIRKDMLDDIKSQEDGASEDDVKRAQDQVQKLIDKHVDQIDKLTAAKEAEILEV